MGADLARVVLVEGAEVKVVGAAHAGVEGAAVKAADEALVKVDGAKAAGGHAKADAGHARAVAGPEKADHAVAVNRRVNPRVRTREPRVLRVSRVPQQL